MHELLARIRDCTLCADHLPLPPQPILAASTQSRVLLIGQAPGRKTLLQGRPFSDASGVRLREWLGVSDTTFYDPDRFAIVPMGFCYPGTGKSGHLPPRPECAPQWHPPLLDAMRPALTLLVGRHAIDHYAPHSRGSTLAQLVRDDREPARALLPHPSPRNTPWLRRNPWFERETLPRIQQLVADALSPPTT